MRYGISYLICYSVQDCNTHTHTLVRPAGGAVQPGAGGGCAGARAGPLEAAPHTRQLCGGPGADGGAVLPAGARALMQHAVRGGAPAGTRHRCCGCRMHCLSSVCICVSAAYCRLHLPTACNSSSSLCYEGSVSTGSGVNFAAYTEIRRCSFLTHLTPDLP